jgi:hypothetical protein
MAFVATLDRIDKVKNVEDEMMNYVKFKAAMEKRDWDEEDEIAILQIVGTTSYHVLFLDSYNSLDEIKKELKIKFIPLLTKEKSIDVAKGEDADEILHAFTKRSQELQNGQWRNGWHAFCVKVQDSYKGVLQGLCTPETKENATERFSHYLDCEAHTDVWKELFSTWNMTNEK